MLVSGLAVQFSAAAHLQSRWTPVPPENSLNVRSDRNPLSHQNEEACEKTNVRQAIDRIQIGRSSATQWCSALPTVLNPSESTFTNDCNPSRFRQENRNDLARRNSVQHLCVVSIKVVQPSSDSKSIGIGVWPCAGQANGQPVRILRELKRLVLPQ